MLSSAVVSGSTSAAGGQMTRVEDGASGNGLAVRVLWLSMWAHSLTSP